MPCNLFLLCFVKKLTVRGIIGKTQGVNKAVKPNKKASKNIESKSPESASICCSFFMGFFKTSFPLNESRTSLGGKHLFSSQAMKEISTLILSKGF